eukprot:TRINITY_DN265_c0_g1_i1.p1 TRINITY_DN265_c0_g1~~TRINITY_DN265_c0_g1_i1.p1  ORF type:complete len:136 (-),score=18.65 TRINITY_DN265_c0_g1_i1:99-506(-)
MSHNKHRSGHSTRPDTIYPAEIHPNPLSRGVSSKVISLPSVNSHGAHCICVTGPARHNSTDLPIPPKLHTQPTQEETGRVALDSHQRGDIYHGDGIWFRSRPSGAYKYEGLGIYEKKHRITRRVTRRDQDVYLLQ